jgi:hypothetical protein
MKTKIVTMRFSPEIEKLIRDEAKKNCRTLSGQIEWWIREKVQEQTTVSEAKNDRAK